VVTAFECGEKLRHVGADENTPPGLPSALACLQEVRHQIDPSDAFRYGESPKNRVRPQTTPCPSALTTIAFLDDLQRTVGLRHLSAHTFQRLRTPCCTGRAWRIRVTATGEPVSSLVRRSRGTPRKLLREPIKWTTH
jgi:hypothetical protein